MTALLLLLALALDQGVRYSGRTQLQQLVDASAQAAMIALSAPGAGRTQADQAARNVVGMTDIIGGTFPSDQLRVEFGRYNFLTGLFELSSGAPQAVRVTAEKMGANSFRSLLTGAPITANADSIAALRCRNLVFVQDVSASFREDITKVQDALRQTINRLRDQEAGGVETRVGLVAFRNIVVPAATTPTLTPISDGAIDRAIAALDDDNVLCKGRIQQVSLTRFIVPACVGSDMRGALEEAEELLEPGNGKNQSCEDLVLTISDGVPCKVTAENLDEGLSGLAALANLEFGPALPGEPQGGGSTFDETIDYVDEDMRETGSIAVLTANSGTPPQPLSFPPTQEQLDSLLGSCPQARTSSETEQQINTRFARSLITGFGQAFESNRTATTMADEMSAALQTIPPVVVQ